MTKENKAPAQDQDSEKPATEQVAGGQTELTKADAEPAKDVTKPDAAKPEPKAKAKAAPEGKVTIIVVGPAKGRWRAGRHFGPEPVSIPVADLTDDQLLALKGDPELIVSAVTA